jgi:hypothetical protein
MYKAVVTKLKNVRPHPNADRVQLATCHGNQVVIGLSSTEDEMGVYFPSDGQLSHEFCFANNLYREAKLNSNPDERPGMFDLNRRVRAQRFRGEISDGFWVPLSNFSFVGKTVLVGDIRSSSLEHEGYEFDEISGVPICSKYINPATEKIARENQGKKTRTAKTSIMFKEHFDTGHFGKNIHEFDQGQMIIITEKLHGTSGRIGHVQIDRTPSLVEKIAQWFGAKVQIQEWKYLNGTRRVVLEETSGTQFHDPTIRDKAFNMFNGNLRKGETVFFEIVGFESTGAAIMPAVDTTKMGDKEFTKKYGEKMYYSYGCGPTESKIYVYRMTYTNEEGHTIDYSWEDVVSRCKEIGVQTVPFIGKVTLAELDLIVKMKDAEPDFEFNERNAKDELSKIVELYGYGPSVLDSTHIKEGVCVRIEGGLHNKTFKYKSFEFKVLEGIVKDSGVIDAEEAEG